MTELQTIKNILALATTATIAAATTKLFLTATQPEHILQNLIPNIAQLLIKLKIVNIDTHTQNQLLNLKQQYLNTKKTIQQNPNLNHNLKKQFLQQKFLYQQTLIQTIIQHNPQILKPLGLCYICTNTYIALITATLTSIISNNFLNPILIPIVPLLSVFPLQIIFLDQNLSNKN